MKFACVTLLCLALTSAVTAQTTTQTSAPQNLAQALQAAPSDLSTLKAALNASGITPALSNNSLTWTVLAPTNQAFAAAIAALNTTATALLSNKALLTTILEYHVIPGAAYYSYNLTDGAMVPTLLGPNLTVSLGSGNATFVGATNNASVIVPDIAAGNSVVHVVNTVLVPPMQYLMAASNGTMAGMNGTMNSTSGMSGTSTAGTTSSDGSASSVTSGSTTTGSSSGTAGGATSAAAPQAVFGLMGGAVAAAAVLGSMLL